MGINLNRGLPPPIQAPLLPNEGARTAASFAQVCYLSKTQRQGRLLH
jgi:hypothetical protein